ncbi:hypothetical protein JCM8097_006793 [Rhodosporidiobolus ruineniae]
MVRIAVAAVALTAAGSAFAASVPESAINAGLERRGLWDSVTNAFSSDDTKIENGMKQMAELVQGIQGVWNISAATCNSQCAPWGSVAYACVQKEAKDEAKSSDNGTQAVINEMACLCAASTRAVESDCSTCLDIDDDKVGYMCDMLGGEDYNWFNTSSAEQAVSDAKADSSAGTLKLASAAALAAVAGIAAIAL